MSEKFVVPECFRADAKWRGDIVIRTRHGRDEEGEDCESQIVEFYCHSGVICLSNSFFDTALSGEWSESWVSVSQVSATMDDVSHAPVLGVVDMQEEDAETIRELLFYLYPRLEVTITLDNWSRLVTLADKINEPHLARLCKDFALKQADKDPLTVLEVAATLGLEEIFDKSSSNILADFRKYRTQEAYMALDSQLRVLFEKAHIQWLEACIQALGKSHKEVRDFKPEPGFLAPVRGVETALQEFEKNPSFRNARSVAIVATSCRFASIAMTFEGLKKPRIAWDTENNCPLGLDL